MVFILSNFLAAGLKIVGYTQKPKPRSTCTQRIGVNGPSNDQVHSSDGSPASLCVVLLYDLIELNGDDLRRDPLQVPKATLASTLAKTSAGIRFNHIWNATMVRSSFATPASSGSKASSPSAGLTLPQWPLASWRRAGPFSSHSKKRPEEAGL